MIIVHRGNQAFRENSLMAVLTSLDKAHMSITEFDVYWTGKKWVLAHDSSKTAYAEDLEYVLAMAKPRVPADSPPRILIDIKWDRPIGDGMTLAMEALAATLGIMKPSSFMLQFPSLEAFHCFGDNATCPKGLLIPSPLMVDWSLLPDSARFVMLDMNTFTLDDIDEIRRHRPGIRVFVYTCKGVSQYLYFRQAVDAVVCDIVW